MRDGGLDGFTPTLGQGIVLWGLFLAATSAAGMFGGALARSWTGSPVAVTLSVALPAAGPAFVLWVGKRLTGRTWSDVLPVRRPSAPAALLVVVASTGLLLAELGLLVLLAEHLPGAGRDGPGTLGAASVIRTVLVAPAVEEAFFRGLLLGGFLLAYRRWTAILLSAGLFAAIHTFPVQPVTALATGVLLSWVMAGSRNLALPLLGHVVVNAVALAFVAFPALSSLLLGNAVPCGILGVLLLSVGTALLRRALGPATRPATAPP
ncbi:MAG TPA: CPBP family intramembrane glutamic endopeptidase [Anaeromyxobacteraceae bacterium]|nr:CPBP family intramembrane glutamic endopeptidase [Anaeromyxobacteraceae bacterium]